MVLAVPGLITVYDADCCLSDHYPLCFSLDFNSSPLPGPPYKSLHIDWQNISNCDIDKYIHLFRFSRHFHISFCCL